MNALELLGAALVALGTCFFGVGAVGLLRLPDAMSRLQGVFKASSLGLSLTVLGLSLQAHSVFSALKLVSIGVLLLVTASTAGQLLGRALCRGAGRG